MFAICVDLQVDTEAVAWSGGVVDFEASIDGAEQTIHLKISQKEPYTFPVKGYRINTDYSVLESLEGRIVTFLRTAKR